VFEAFWTIYPRKTAKANARKSWERAIRRADPSVIIDGAQRYRDDPNREDEFTCHGATWLNQDRWDDPPLPARKRRTTAGRTADAFASARADLAEIVNGNGRHAIGT
jgi:hypothetical protein